MLVPVDGSIVLIPSIFRPANLGVHRNPRSPFHIHIFLHFPAESRYLDAHRGSWQRFHPQSRQLLSPSGEVVKLFIITKLAVIVDEHDCEVLEWNTAIDRLRQAADNGGFSAGLISACGDRSLALCWSSGCRRLSAAPVFWGFYSPTCWLFAPQGSNGNLRLNTMVCIITQIVKRDECEKRCRDRYEFNRFSRCVWSDLVIRPQYLFSALRGKRNAVSAPFIKLFTSTQFVKMFNFEYDAGKQVLFTVKDRNK